MNSLRISFLALLAFVALANAKPRYIAIPLLHDFKIIEVDESLEDTRPRIVRQIPYDGFEDDRPKVVRQPVQQKQTLEGLEAESTGDNYRFERQAGGGDSHEHVDYGAHTGHHGAFGWYADFPVHSH